MYTILSYTVFNTCKSNNLLKNTLQDAENTEKALSGTNRASNGMLKIDTDFNETYGQTCTPLILMQLVLYPVNNGTFILFIRYSLLHFLLCKGSSMALAQAKVLSMAFCGILQNK